MTALVVYDSAYGNTERIAEAIAAALPGPASARRVSEADPRGLAGLSLLIAGSPTQGGRPAKAMQEWLAAIPQGGLKGVRVAAFDTRMAAADQNFMLRTLMGVIGYAAPRILRDLEGRGGVSVAPPGGFVVEGREGPLRTAELERAASWARSLAETARAAA